MTEIGLGDPDTKTAAIRSERGLCADCPQYPKCLFHMPRYGGFKKQGKRHVAYAMITDAVENSNAKEDFCTCENFVEVLQDRMLSGLEAASAGRKGAEVVRILLNRTTVTQGMEMGFNSQGEIIKPQLNQVADLERSGHKVNVKDNTMPVRYDMVTFERTIPDYSVPPKTQSLYSENIRAREAEIRRQEMEDEGQRFEERLTESGAPLKRRGRPPGSRNRTKDDGDDFEKSE